MTLEWLKDRRKVIGSKQVKKALAEGQARVVFLAVDAEERITEPLRRMCSEQGVELNEQFDMSTLGRAARVEVKTAAVALLD